MPTPFLSAGSAPKVRKTVGIDLGTTNSVIALLDAADSALLTGADEQGRQTFPSVLGWHAEQKRLVAGRPARDLKAPGPRETAVTLPLSSVKRFMGLDKQWTLGPETLTPPQASAVILRHLREMMARTLNDPKYLLDSAVVTMPAYFNHNQIEATRQAGELAGYDVVELLHEPTAAAMYYSWVENHGDAVYLVYDLGGGTFDVSVIRRRLGDYEVLGVSGDPFLGGDDFDRLLATHLIEQGGVDGRRREFLLTPHSSLLTRSLSSIRPRRRGPSISAGWFTSRRAIKIALTDAERVERYVPGLTYTDDGKALALETAVARTDFNRLIKDKVDRTIDSCRDALARARDRAGVGLSDVDYVVLVGGSSRVPLVRETVRTAFCNPNLPEHVRSPEPLLHEPDLCVAYGAALRAASHGTHYLFAKGSGVRGQGSGEVEEEIDLHVTSPANTSDPNYPLTGIVRVRRSSAGLRSGRRFRARPLAGHRIDGRGVSGRARFLRARAGIAAGNRQRPGTGRLRRRGPRGGADGDRRPLPERRPGARPGGAADADHHQAAANRGARPRRPARQAGGRAGRGPFCPVHFNSPAGRTTRPGASSCRSSRRIASSSK